MMYLKRYLLLGIFLPFVTLGVQNQLNFAGYIQCINPNTGKLDAEYSILVQRKKSTTEGVMSLVQFYEKYSPKYLLVQTETGKCKPKDLLNVRLVKPVDSLILIKQLAKIFKLQYIFDGNLKYKPSYVIFYRKGWTVNNLISFLVSQIAQANPKVKITLSFKDNILVVSKETVTTTQNVKEGTSCPNLNTVNYVTLCKGSECNKYILNINPSGIELIPYENCFPSIARSEIKNVCKNKEPVLDLYVDNIDLPTLLRVFEKLFGITFVFDEEKLSEIKNSDKLHLAFSCLSTEKALEFLKKYFHVYIQKITENTYRIYKNRDDYSLVMQQISKYLTKLIYLKGISSTEFAHLLDVYYQGKIQYTVDPTFNAVVLSGPEKIVNEILAKFKAYIRNYADFDNLITKIFYVKFGDIDELTKKIQNYLSDEGTIKKLTDIQAIEITDYPSNLSMIQKVFGRFLSQNPIKIKVSVKFVSISKDFARSLGISWSANYGGNNVAESVNSITVNMASGILQTNFSFIYKKLNPLNLAISAAESLTLAKTLSSPTLILLNNQQGTISRGTQIPYQSVDQNGNPKTELVSAATSLTVTPQLLPDGRILLKLNLSKSSPNTALAVNGQPAINSFTVTQNIVIPDGGTIAIGGILEKTNQTGENGVPIFRQIPLLGWLFGSKTWQKSNQELLILVTAKVVSN